MPFANVAKLTGHDEDTLKSIYHHVSGEVVTPEIQKAADFLETLQREADAANVTSMLGRQAVP